MNAEFKLIEGQIHGFKLRCQRLVHGQHGASVAIRAIQAGQRVLLDLTRIGFKHFTKTITQF